MHAKTANPHHQHQSGLRISFTQSFVRLFLSLLCRRISSSSAVCQMLLCLCVKYCTHSHSTSIPYIVSVVHSSPFFSFPLRLYVVLFTAHTISTALCTVIFSLPYMSNSSRDYRVYMLCRSSVRQRKTHSIESCSFSRPNNVRLPRVLHHTSRCNDMRATLYCFVSFHTTFIFFFRILPKSRRTSYQKHATTHERRFSSFFSLLKYDTREFIRTTLVVKYSTVKRYTMVCWV